MDQDKTLHLLILKKSYEVIVKSLTIRLELLRNSAEHSSVIEGILKDKINRYYQQIKEIDQKLHVL